MKFQTRTKVKLKFYIMNIWYSTIVTAMSVLLVILFPMPEYRDYVMFGLLAFIISINRWENDKILKAIKADTSHDSKVLNIPRVNGWHLFSEQKPTEGDNIEVYYDDKTIVNVDWQDYLYRDKEFKHMRFWRACR